MGLSDAALEQALDEYARISEKVGYALRQINDLSERDPQRSELVEHCKTLTTQRHDARSALMDLVRQRTTDAYQAGIETR